MLQVQIPSDPLTSLFQPVEASTTVSHFLLHPRALTLILAFMSRNNKNKRVPPPPLPEKKRSNIHGNFRARFVSLPCQQAAFVYGFSFIKWKIADSIVCYLLPFWYETLFRAPSLPSLWGFRRYAPAIHIQSFLPGYMDIEGNNKSSIMIEANKQEFMLNNQIWTNNSDLELCNLSNPKLDIIRFGEKTANYSIETQSFI